MSSDRESGFFFCFTFLIVLLTTKILKILAGAKGTPYSVSLTYCCLRDQIYLKWICNLRSPVTDEATKKTPGLWLIKLVAWFVIGTWSLIQWHYKVMFAILFTIFPQVLWQYCIFFPKIRNNIASGLHFQLLKTSVGLIVLLEVIFQQECLFFLVSLIFNVICLLCPRNCFFHLVVLIVGYSDELRT